MTDKVTSDSHDEFSPASDLADRDATTVSRDPEVAQPDPHGPAQLERTQLESSQLEPAQPESIGAVAEEPGDGDAALDAEAPQDETAIASPVSASPESASPVSASTETAPATGSFGNPMPEVPDLLARIAGRINGDEGNQEASAENSTNEASQEANAADDMRQRLRQLQEQAEASRTEVQQSGESPFANAEAALAKLSQQVEAQEDFAAEPTQTSQVDEGVVAGSPEKPWNEDAAETLTTHCEDAGLTDTEQKDDLLIGTPATSEANAPVSYVYMQPEVSEAGPQWFAQRFDEMSKRLDAVVSDKPQNISSDLAGLVERFDALEVRLSELLDQTTAEGGVAASGGSLHDIELCIAEIAGQLEATTAELARIEGIEQKIAEVASAISEQRSMVASAASVEGGMPSPFDMAALADLVADKVSAKPMPLMAGDTGDTSNLSGSIGELSVTMKDFVRERRSEGEHTNAVLDTMQQTIIRVLDRMEALEAGAPRAGGRLQQSSGQVAAAPAPAAGSDDAPKPMPAGAPVYVDAEPATPAASNNVAAPEKGAAPAEPEDLKSPESVSIDRLQRVMGQLDGRDKAAAEKPKAAEPQAARGGGAGIARDRANLVKAARQAAAKADQSVEGEPVEEGDSDRARFAAAARQAAANANRRLVNDDTTEGEIDATHDGFSLDSLGERLQSVTGSKKQAATSRGRARLLVAALAIVVVGLGATKYMMSTSGKPAPQQLQSSHVQEGVKTAQQKATAPIVKVALPTRENGAAAFAQGLRSNEAVDLTQKDALVQPASVPPGTATGPVSGAPGSVSRKHLPSALVGPLSMRLAAANGDPSAEFQVASRYADGKGVKQDLEEALKWYRRSASRGFALSQYRLGTFYERGLSVAKDVQRAQVWYQRAASLGNVKAMHNLAVLAAGSSAGKPDYATAAKWFTAAAERGLGDSQFNLAILYRNGLGVSKDDEQAYKWFSRAGSAGDKEALRRMKEVETTLGNDKVARLRSEMSRWTQKSTSKMANDPHYAGQAWQRKSADNS